MKCHILFSGKNKKNITKLSSAELAQRVELVKVKFLKKKKKKLIYSFFFHPLIKDNIPFYQ